MSGGEWDRDLGVDIEALRQWGCTALLSLIEDHEIEELKIQDVAEQLHAKIVYYRLPIVDGFIPDAQGEEMWDRIGPNLRRRLANGERIVIHCKGGGSAEPASLQLAFSSSSERTRKVQSVESELHVMER